MKTRKTISNISYNSLAHFREVVTRLVQRGVIEWCYWIFHFAEDDELKNHIHLVLQPSGTLETAQLEKEFLEVDPNNDKPLGLTKKWNPTSGEEGMSNWLLYVLHHSGYLASKGQYRKFHYQVEDLNSTDPDALREDLHKVNYMQFARLQALADAVSEGKPFALLVQEGTVPINLRAQYQQQYNELAKLKWDGLTGRRQSHEYDAFLQPMDEEFVQIPIEDAMVSFKKVESNGIGYDDLTKEEREALAGSKPPASATSPKKPKKAKKTTK